MLALAVSICAAANASPALWLRHLDSAAEAWSPAPSTDGTRVAFLTTLFGTRQAAAMSAEGSYPVQLTDEPEGARAVRWAPGPARDVLVEVLREGKRRLLLAEEDKGALREIDPLPGEMRPGAFTRDGKRFFYELNGALKEMALQTGKTVAIEPPPPAAGITPPKDSVSLDEALKGLRTLGPLSPDQRTLLAVAARGAGDALYAIDLSSARAVQLATDAGRIEWPQFGVDSRIIYARTSAGIETLAAGARKLVFAPGKGELQAFALSPDGHRLAVAVESAGETVFSLLDLPSLRPEPLSAPPAGALGLVEPGELPMQWDRGGERLFFAWRLPDDTTDVWALRYGYGTPLRLTRSPRPGLARDSIPRPTPLSVKGSGATAWLWRPPDAQGKPRVAVLATAKLVPPVFDKRVAALCFAGRAVLAIAGPDAQADALAWLRDQDELSAESPLLLDFENLPVAEPARWMGVVGTRGGKDALPATSPDPARAPRERGLLLDPDVPDLHALVDFASH